MVWRQLKELTDLLFLTLFPIELRDLLSLLFLMELEDLLGLLVVGEWWMSRDSKMRLVMEATGPSTEETHEVETSHLVALERDEGGGGNLELEHTGVGKLGGDRYKDIRHPALRVLRTTDAIRKGSSPKPKLHALILKLKRLEMAHCCSLVVIHVPGVLMIAQSTGGLSRGIWASELSNRPGFSISDMFRPVPFSANIIGWALSATSKT